MARVCILSHVALPQDGVGIVAHAIRAHEIGRSLSKLGHRVDRVTLNTSERGRDAGLRQAAQSDVVIVSSALASAVQPIKRLRRSCLVVIDMFDAPLVGMIPDLLSGRGAEIQFEFSRLTINRACEAADAFACASEEQRFWLLGLLSALGRLNPLTYRSDLVLVVPTGTPVEPPTASPTPLFRGRILQQKAEVIIWPGGIFNHYQPLPVLQALPQVLAKRPAARLVFVGLMNAAFPGDVAEREAVYSLASELNGTERVVFFEPPLPYAQRGQMYADADIAVCLFEQSLETELSFRTRLVDVLWGGVPVVTSRAGGLTRLIERTQSGVVLDSLDPRGVADALVSLLQDSDARDRMAANARTCATRDLSWDKTILPLHAYCSGQKPPGDEDGLVRQFASSGLGRLGNLIRRSLLRARRKALTFPGSSGKSG